MRFIMTFELSSFFRDRRTAMGLGRGRLALLVGFTNPSRGARRIQEFEEQGIVQADLLAKLMAVLGVDQATVDGLLERDAREGFRRWCRWANEPVKPCVGLLRSGPMPVSKAVPDGIVGLDDAEEFAAAFARTHHSTVALVWSRRHRVVLDAEGAVVERIEQTAEAWPWVPLILG
jgi:hypothetical protein